MVRFFVSVIAIWCVFFACFFFCLFCTVCFVFMWVFSLVSVVLVRHIDGRKVQRSRVVCNFASSFGWLVVVVFMFSCVSKFRYDMLRFGYCGDFGVVQQG